MKTIFSFLFSILFVSSYSQELSSDSISALVDPSVVEIDTYNIFNQMISHGSGVILTADGYVVTNYHVFNGGNSLTVTNEYLKQTYPSSSILFGDTSRDFLVFKINAPNLKPIKIGNSDSLRKGLKVFAMGSPYGVYVNNFTDGIISNIQKLSEDDSHTFIYHTAQISPGNSGGALVNTKGELIGINTRVSTRQMVQSINYAIPINDILKILNQNQLTSVIFNGGSVAGTKTITPPSVKYDMSGFEKGLQMPNTPSNNIYGAGNCGLVLWTNSSNTLDIYVNNTYEGRLSTPLPYNQNSVDFPVYGQYGTISMNLKAGTYRIKIVIVNLNNYTYETNLDLKEGFANKSCIAINQINFPSIENSQPIFLDKYGNKPIYMIRLNNNDKFYILNSGEIYAYNAEGKYTYCSKKEPPSFYYWNGKSWAWSFKVYTSRKKYILYNVSTDSQVWSTGVDGVFQQYGSVTYIDF